MSGAARSRLPPPNGRGHPVMNGRLRRARHAVHSMVVFFFNCRALKKNDPTQWPRVGTRLMRCEVDNDPLMVDVGLDIPS